MSGEAWIGKESSDNKDEVENWSQINDEDTEQDLLRAVS